MNKETLKTKTFTKIDCQTKLKFQKHKRHQTNTIHVYKQKGKKKNNNKIVFGGLYSIYNYQHILTQTHPHSHT